MPLLILATLGSGLLVTQTLKQSYLKYKKHQHKRKKEWNEG
ncbi:MULTISPECIES: hypothetical protein [Helicobacter]|nr:MULTISPECIES: hypothetical protein [Helicobacter]MDY5557168.1 hypothetical protein [Helicobacter sp.]